MVLYLLSLLNVRSPEVWEHPLHPGPSHPRKEFVEARVAPAAQPSVGDKRDRQMRLRPQGEEANEDPDQSASVDPEGSDRKRAMQSGEVHGQPDEQREDGTPGPDLPKQQGEEDRHRRKEGEALRSSKQGGEKRTRRGAHCGNVRDDPVSALCAAKDIWSNDEDTNARKKREMITETAEDRPKKTRTRKRGFSQPGCHL